MLQRQSDAVFAFARRSQEMCALQEGTEYEQKGGQKAVVHLQFAHKETARGIFMDLFTWMHCALLHFLPLV